MRVTVLAVSSLSPSMAFRRLSMRLTSALGCSHGARMTTFVFKGTVGLYIEDSPGSRREPHRLTAG